MPRQGASSPSAPADAALARLRSPSDPALGSLARLVVDEALTRPASELVRPAELAPILSRALKEAAGSAGLRAGLVARLTTLRTQAARDRRPLGDRLAPEARAAAAALLALPLSPSPDLTYRLINHEALRTLLREVLQGTLARFASGMRAVDQGALGGLAGRVAARSRGLLGAAEGIVGAVRGELESAFEGRVKDFVSGALDEAVRSVATWLSDPAHAPLAAGMRVSILDVLLDVPLGDLVSEADELGTDAVVDAVLAAVRQVAERPDLTTDVERALAEALAPWSEERLEAVLTDLGLAEAARQGAVSAFEPLLREVAGTEAFAEWWQQLHG